jgi:hypothetical protein
MQNGRINCTLLNPFFLVLHSLFQHQSILVLLLPLPWTAMTSPPTRFGVKRRNEAEGTVAEGSRSLEAEFMLAVDGGSYGAVQR